MNYIGCFYQVLYYQTELHHIPWFFLSELWLRSESNKKDDLQDWDNLHIDPVYLSTNGAEVIHIFSNTGITKMDPIQQYQSYSSAIHFPDLSKKKI